MRTATEIRDKAYWAAKRESDYKQALQRYYETGTAEDQDECLRLFGLWMITSRGLRQESGLQV